MHVRRILAAFALAGVAATGGATLAGETAQANDRKHPLAGEYTRIPADECYHPAPIKGKHGHYVRYWEDGSARYRNGWTWDPDKCSRNYERVR